MFIEFPLSTLHIVCVILVRTKHIPQLAAHISQLFGEIYEEFVYIIKHKFEKKIQNNAAKCVYTVCVCVGARVTEIF